MRDIYNRRGYRGDVPTSIRYAPYSLYSRYITIILDNLGEVYLLYFWESNDNTKLRCYGNAKPYNAMSIILYYSITTVAANNAIRCVFTVRAGDDIIIVILYYIAIDCIVYKYNVGRWLL